jgi:hypothetical protein
LRNHFVRFRLTPVGTTAARFREEKILQKITTKRRVLLDGCKIFVRIAMPFGTLCKIIGDRRVDGGGTVRWVDNIHVRQD